MQIAGLSKQIQRDTETSDSPPLSANLYANDMVNKRCGRICCELEHNLARKIIMNRDNVPIRSSQIGDRMNTVEMEA